MNKDFLIILSIMGAMQLLTLIRVEKIDYYLRFKQGNDNNENKK